MLRNIVETAALAIVLGMLLRVVREICRERDESDYDNVWPTEKTKRDERIN